MPWRAKRLRRATTSRKPLPTTHFLPGGGTWRALLWRTACSLLAASAVAGGGQTAGHLLDPARPAKSSFEPLAAGEEIRLGGHQLVHQAAVASIFDDVAPREGSPARRRPSASGPPSAWASISAQRGQRWPDRHKRLVGLSRRRLKPASDRRWCPRRWARKILLAPVHPQVVGIELVRNNSRQWNLINFCYVRRPRGAHSFGEMPTIHTSANRADKWCMGCAGTTLPKARVSVCWLYWLPPTHHRQPTITTL